MDNQAMASPAGRKCASPSPAPSLGDQRSWYSTDQGQDLADLIAETLRNVVKEGDGVTVVVITHDLRIMKAADRVVALDKV